MSQTNHTEIAIVGAGIVGLAHALAAAKRGYKVTVFERNLEAVGASIRNFGMVWPVGQPNGKLRDRAFKSREIWLDVVEKAGLYHDPSGSLLLAYRQDELDVLEEFMATNEGVDTIALLNAEAVAKKSEAAITEGLLGALWSSTEVTVDPREVIQKLPAFLASNYPIEFQFGKVVNAIAYPNLQ
ncbi:MAG: FAD-dependent oxidoreductase, partial [Pseudanabaena sp.]